MRFAGNDALSTCQLAIQSLRAFRRPMHAWMRWIVVGTGRMKDALWKKVKQGIVSCDYKYSFLLLEAFLMFGSCRLYIGLAGGSGHGRCYRNHVLWNRFQVGWRWSGLSVCVCVCGMTADHGILLLYLSVFQWKWIALHCFLWTCCAMLEGIVDTVKRHRYRFLLLWNGFWFGQLVSMLRSNYLDFWVRT